MEPRSIRIFGARQHNLRGFDLELPRDRLIVMTGLSGSGKSSLAFNTIYAEGRRKYVESLSVHARLFLEQVGKPDVDRIEGLPPTLAIEQLAAAPNPRSIVATSTEIYDFLRLLFARLGQPHCPSCGRRLARRTVDQIVNEVLALPVDTRIMVLAPIVRGPRGEAAAALRRIQREGFVRARINGEVVEVRETTESPKSRRVIIDAVVDRLVIRPDIRRRLSDAIELSLRLGEGAVLVARAANAAGDPRGEWIDAAYSENHVCPDCGVSVADLSPRMFSFNSPHGACVECDGLGVVPEFDAGLIVPDDELSLAEGAVAPWRGVSAALGQAYGKIVKTLCAALDAKPSTAFRGLPDDLKRIILNGTTKDDTQRLGVEFEGVVPTLKRRLAGSEKDQGRARLAAFQVEYPCRKCRGARLRPESLAVRIGEFNIHDLTRMTAAAGVEWLAALHFESDQAAIAEPILAELGRRLRFLSEVGLGYLSLDRASATLSGGEAQRIRLATQLGSGLVGVCYVLDEPTIGLHQRDNQRLLACIRRLVDIGNTVIVVEHDEDVIRAADYLVDMGPGAGLHGGCVIAQGPTAQALADPRSVTGRFLQGDLRIQVPEQRRAPRRSDLLQILGAAENNLKQVNVSIPLGVLCAVTGVSGSGKSTLIAQTLLPALRRRLSGARTPAADGSPAPKSAAGFRAALPARNVPIGRHDRLVGAARIDRVIEIDQAPIGRTPRSNPSTYTGVFDEMRRLFARTKEAKIRGYDSSRFSFNAKGGRCEACQGQGTRRIEMHFLPDVFVECGHCRGTRYNRETLEVRYRGKSIADVLAMRVEEALRFFDSFSKIKSGIQALSDVGLGYIALGQPSNTLSGGEAQRVKLAAELARPTAGHTLYVLDEPTTGLHFADIDMLLSMLKRLVDLGNTVLVIEHNLEVIKCADWIIDLGPEGGDAGGQVVCEGTPETVAACAASHTGRYLKEKLNAAK